MSPPNGSDPPPPVGNPSSTTPKAPSTPSCFSPLCLGRTGSRSASRVAELDVEGGVAACEVEDPDTCITIVTNFTGGSGSLIRVDVRLRTCAAFLTPSPSVRLTIDREKEQRAYREWNVPKRTHHLPLLDRDQTALEACKEAESQNASCHRSDLVHKIGIPHHYFTYVYTTICCKEARAPTWFKYSSVMWVCLGFYTGNFFAVLLFASAFYRWNRRSKWVDSLNEVMREGETGFHPGDRVNRAAINDWMVAYAPLAETLVRDAFTLCRLELCRLSNLPDYNVYKWKRPESEGFGKAPLNLALFFDYHELVKMGLQGDADIPSYLESQLAYETIVPGGTTRLLPTDSRRERRRVRKKMLLKPVRQKLDVSPTGGRAFTITTATTTTTSGLSEAGPQRPGNKPSQLFTLQSNTRTMSNLHTVHTRLGTAQESALSTDTDFINTLKPPLPPPVKPPLPPPVKPPLAPPVKPPLAPPVKPPLPPPVKPPLPPPVKPPLASPVKPPLPPPSHSAFTQVVKPLLPQPVKPPLPPPSHSAFTQVVKPILPPPTHSAITQLHSTPYPT